MRFGRLMRRLHLSGLVWRFLIIGLAALAPLIGALIQLAGEEKKIVVEATRERAELLASYMSDRQTRIADEARLVLRFLADAWEIQSTGGECAAFIGRHLSLYPWIDHVRLYDSAGVEICSDQRSEHGRNVIGQDLLAAIQARAEFSLGDLTLGASKDSPRMTAAVPVLRGRDLIGALVAGINLRLFSGYSQRQFSSGLDANLLLLDRSGTLLAHHPPAENLIGVDIRTNPVVQKALQLPKGMVEVSDLFGVPRHYVFRALPGTDAILAVGLSRGSVIAAINEALRHRLILITLIIVGSVLLGILGIDSLILRPLRSLSRTAESLERGHLDSRAPKEGAGEVRTLARALNRMADAVAERERELIAAKDIAERALGNANAASLAKSDFLASMSHEIRTPLNGIVGYTERLLEDTLTPRQRRYADLIQVSVSALLTVANDVLDFSSIEADQIRLQHDPFSLISLVDDTVSIVSSGAGKKGVPIRIAFDPEIPEKLVGDEARLRQVLLNLLNNAVKFTREGQISTVVQYKGRSEAGEIICVSVRDTGIGIPSSKHDRLFKRFSQVDPSIRREFGGTGLGLAICKRLIELMGGTIGFESEEGKGSTFWIQLALPRYEPVVSGAGEPAAKSDAAPARILLVEDVEINQELVQALLMTAGHEVDIVSNGEDAIVAVRSKTYDLVFMDIQMPGMDGITAAREIRKIEKPGSRTCIVAMTANVLPQQVQSFGAAGIDDHIGKPIRREELLRRLTEWLPKRPHSLQPDERCCQQQSFFNRQAFDDFCKMMGPQRVGHWLKRFDHELSATFAEDSFAESDRHRIAGLAHALIPQAALLGFSDLAQRCTGLENACRLEEDHESALQDVRESARFAREKIAQLRREDENLSLLAG